MKYCSGRYLHVMPSFNVFREEEISLWSPSHPPIFPWFLFWSDIPQGDSATNMQTVWTSIEPHFSFIFTTLYFTETFHRDLVIGIPIKNILFLMLQHKLSRETNRFWRECKAHFTLHILLNFVVPFVFVLSSYVRNFRDDCTPQLSLCCGPCSLIGCLSPPLESLTHLWFYLAR